MARSRAARTSERRRLENKGLKEHFFDLAQERDQAIKQRDEAVALMEQAQLARDEALASLRLAEQTRNGAQASANKALKLSREAEARFMRCVEVVKRIAPMGLYDDPEGTDTLYTNVTAAITNAETLRHQGRSIEAIMAYRDVCAIEQSIARVVPASDVEGTIARRSAVMAASNGGNPGLAVSLADHYMRDDVPDEIRQDLDALRRLAEPIAIRCATEAWGGIELDLLGKEPADNLWTKLDRIFHLDLSMQRGEGIEDDAEERKQLFESLPGTVKHVLDFGFKGGLLACNVCPSCGENFENMCDCYKETTDGG